MTVTLAASIFRPFQTSRSDFGVSFSPSFSQLILACAEASVRFSIAMARRPAIAIGFTQIWTSRSRLVNFNRLQSVRVVMNFQRFSIRQQRQGGPEKDASGLSRPSMEHSKLPTDPYGPDRENWSCRASP